MGAADLQAASVREVLGVRDLCVRHRKRGSLRTPWAESHEAVAGVSFAVAEEESLGIVGESGCGKSTLARALVRLIEPSAGAVTFEGSDVRSLRGPEFKRFRREVQVVFQDPFASLNPRMTIAEVVAEPLAIHRVGTAPDRARRAAALLETVGMDSSCLGLHPHQFSGGERQRIAIARAIALEPRLLIADEPVSSLDASVRAQVLDVFRALKDDLGLALILIAHDLSVVERVADRVAVMYLGKIVEIAEAGRLFAAPHHPYTQALLSAAPVADPRMQRARARIVLPGEAPSALRPPSGCRLHTRCPIAQFPICHEEQPLLRRVGAGHLAACHLAAPNPIPVPRLGADAPRESSRA